MSQKYLFVLHFGPVQSFIRHSRKVQDLFAGSLLLSALCQKGIDLVKVHGTKHGAVIKEVFPNTQVSPYKPNRFLVQLDFHKAPANINSLGEDVETDLRDFFVQKMTAQVIGLKSVYFPTVTDLPDGFEAQLRQHLEVYWCIRAVAPDYPTTYKMVQADLAAVRNARQFTQLNWQIHPAQTSNPSISPGEIGRKCQLDGQLNVKVYRLSSGEEAKAQQQGEAVYYPKLANKKLFTDLPESKFIKYAHNQKGIPDPTLRHIQPGEGLSAVSFAKRLFENKAYKFLSTADICVSHLKKEFPVPFKDFDTMMDCLLGIDPEDNAQLAYDHNLTDNYVKKNLSYPQIDKWSAAATKELVLKAQQNLELQIGKALGKGKRQAMPTYYALVSFDGDNMGYWWSGKGLKDDTQLLKFHQRFAEQLAVFGKTIQMDRSHLEAHKAQSVYCGEENLFLVNLEYLFDLTKQWREAFDTQISIPLSKEFNLKSTTNFGFSAGIVIAHYKEPLALALEQLAALEKKAKAFRVEKDSFCLGVIKRGGEYIESSWPWKINESWTPDFLQKITEDLRLGVSSTFIQRLAADFGSLLDEMGNLDLPDPLITAELRRLLYRSADGFDKLQMEKLLDEYLTPILKFGRNEGGQDFGNFISLLQSLDFICRSTFGTNKTIAHVV